MIKVYEMIKVWANAQPGESLKMLSAAGQLSVSIQSSKQYYHNYSADGKAKRYLNPDSKYDQRLLKNCSGGVFYKSLSVLKTDISALEQAIAKFVPYDPGRICTRAHVRLSGYSKGSVYNG